MKSTIKYPVRWTRVQVAEADDKGVESRWTEYHAFFDGKKVASAVKTGTHLDDFPWEFDIEPDTLTRPGWRKRGGAYQTLREIKGKVLDALGIDWRTGKPYEVMPS